MAKLIAFDAYVDRYNSLESLIGTNDGQWKSEKQAAFIRDRFGDAMLHAPGTDIDAPMPAGQFIVVVKLRAAGADVIPGTVYSLKYVCNESGVVAKYLIKFGADKEYKATTKWAREVE